MLFYMISFFVGAKLACFIVPTKLFWCYFVNSCKNTIKNRMWAFRHPVFDMLTLQSITYIMPPMPG